MTTLAVSRELNAACAQQDVNTLAIERFTRGVAMQRFRPGGMSVAMATGATLSREELIDGNQPTVFSSRVGGTKRVLRNRRNCAFLSTVA